MKDLHKVFDYYRFEGHDRLQAMISQTGAKYMRTVLEEDDLEFINAAGMRVKDDMDEK